MITFRWFTVLTKTTRHLSDNERYFCLYRNTLSILMSNRKLSELKKTMVGPKPPTEAGSSSEKSKAKKEEFEFFFGNKFIFSQFHPAKFTVDEITYNCMEQYMHHQKAVTFKDSVRANLILGTTDPKQQKKLGRQVTPFDKKVWGQKCVAVVTKGSLAKYRQNLKMKEALFASYPKTLVEASPRDRLWGIGLGRDNVKAQNRATWRGKNLLGDTLTDVRNKMMKEEGLIPVSEQKTLKNAKEECSPAKERNERPEEQKTPAKDKGKPLSSKERNERSVEKKTRSEDKMKHSSSKERKERSEEKQTPTKNKVKHSSSKDREERSEEQKTRSKDKGKHSSSKDREERSEERKTPSKDKVKHSSSKDREERAKEKKTPSKDKVKHSSSKDREERSEGKKTPSKDKRKHMSSKERKERSGEQKLPSEDKGEHSSSVKIKEKPVEQETSLIEVKHLSSEKSDRNETSPKDEYLTSDWTSSHEENTPKNEEQQPDISFTIEKTHTEYEDHSASEKRKEISDSREALSKDDTSVKETNECIMSTSENTPSEDKSFMPSETAEAGSDCKEENFSEYPLPQEETNVLKTNLSESTPPTKEHSLLSRKRPWLPSEEKSENDDKPQPLKKVKLSTDDSTCSLKQPKITHFTIPEKD